MLILEGLNQESLVLDGEWVEKLTLGTSDMRNPVSSYRQSEIKETSRRKYVLFGAKEHLVQVIVLCKSGMAIVVPAERRAEADAFVAALERAAGR